MANLPDLAYRKSLFADGQQGLAYRQEAGYPLGVYLLRGDLTQEQHDLGQRYHADHVRAWSILGAPPPFAKTASYGQAMASKTGEPSAKDVEWAFKFTDWQKTVRDADPVAFSAASLCLIEQVMGKRSERPVNDGLPEYRLDQVIDFIEIFK